jgi:Protein of unknown function, DUF481
MNKFCCLFFFVCFRSLVFAQFNDSTHYRITFASTGVINKTKNTSSYVLNNAASFNINHKKFSQNTSASWIYGQQQKIISNNDLSLNADLDFLKNVHRLYYWALANFDESYSLNINYRFQSGAGIGYSILKKPDMNLSITDGFVYETSDLTDPDLGKDVYQTVRNSFRLKYHFVIKNKVTIDGTHYAQPSLLSLKDYILKSNNVVTVKLNKWLGLNATLFYNKISRTNRENLLITYGLTIENYF